MRKIIDKKIFDTETSEKIAEWDNGLYGNDFYRCEETLYVTQKGNYFLYLYGSGGPASKYAKSQGNTSCSSEDIMFLTKEGVKDWLAKHNEIDILEKLFSDYPEKA